MRHRVVTKEREAMKRTTKQKMTRRHNKEGGNHLEQESNRKKTMEDTDGGLHPAVDGQSLSERWKVKSCLLRLVSPQQRQLTVVHGCLTTAI